MNNESNLGKNELIVPAHIAIIMDSNGRWAKDKGLHRLEGHREGAKSVRRVVEECRRQGVKFLTLYAFSSENWLRPTKEVAGLMRLFAHYLKNEKEKLRNNGVRLRSIGDIENLPPPVQNELISTEKYTAQCEDMQLVLAVSYGGRDEIVRAVRKIVQYAKQKELEQSAIDQEFFKGFLYAPDIPDPDLLIRTSSESRVSNFLLWQIAYSEIIVSDVLWPDFGEKEIQEAIIEFNNRERRFGLTGEQLISREVKLA